MKRTACWDKAIWAGHGPAATDGHGRQPRDGNRFDERFGVGSDGSLRNVAIQPGSQHRASVLPERVAGAQADFDTLIELITTTIEPDTWEEVGGPGAIDGFPTQPQPGRVSKRRTSTNKIADLLGQLRRLQDLQVTIEVRFITLNDDFFERIGVDFRL